MYYKRGPFGLVVISILILAGFLSLAENIPIDPTFFLLFAIFGCPLLSKLIYIAIKNKQIEKEEAEFMQKYQEQLNRKRLENQMLYKKIKSNFIHNTNDRVKMYNELYELNCLMNLQKEECPEEIYDHYIELKYLYDELMEEYKNYYKIQKKCVICDQYIRDHETICPFCKTKIQK